MMTKRHDFTWPNGVLPLAVLTLASCSQGQLPRVKPPRTDAHAAAHEALAQFDLNHDNTVSREEAESSCMAIRDQWERYDRNDDGAISADELQQRFWAWSDDDTGLMNVRVQVTYRNTPLPNAHIRMMPYEFLGPDFLPAKGLTDRYGYAFMAIPKELLPASQQVTHGMQVGLYRVEITHEQLQLPSKYHADSKLSVDLSAEESNTGVHFAL